MAAKKGTAKREQTRREPSNRELLDPGRGGKRFTRRNEDGTFGADQQGVGRSLAADKLQRAKKEVPTGQGDRGDRRPPGGGGRSGARGARGR